MTKAELLAAIADASDDTQLVVVVGGAGSGNLSVEYASADRAVDGVAGIFVYVPLREAQRLVAWEEERLVFQAEEQDS